jgi:tyrosyl-tRNA synthetase
MGGSDQWGNIISGVELGRRADDTSLFAVTAPLITTSDGKKMGKSLGGAIWLNEDLLSPYDYWQYWCVNRHALPPPLPAPPATSTACYPRLPLYSCTHTPPRGCMHGHTIPAGNRRNTADDDVIRFLRLFTELPDERIAQLAELKGQAINEAKLVLADETTRMLHGDECLASIREMADQLFAGGKGGGGGVDATTLPTVEVAAAELEGDGLPVIDLFLRLDFAKSKSEVRRLIAAGGARLNDEKVTDEALTVAAGAFADGQLKVSSGKKKHGIVKLAP